MADDWVALYLEGATLDEVVQLAKLSKQGAADRLRGMGIHVRSAAETHALQEQRIVAKKGDAIRATFLRTRNLRATAHELDLALGVVERSVAAMVPDHKVLTRLPRNNRKRYTDQELLDSLIEAAATTESTLTTATYRKFVDADPALSDGRSRPGHQVMLLRFGSWSAALSAASLPSNRHAGPPKQFEESSAAIASIVACWRDTGGPPTVASYDQWQRGRDGHPSAALSRRLLGGSWDVGLVQAWQVVYDIPLGVDDPDQVAPVLSLAAAAPHFAAYRRGNEYAALIGSVDLTLTNYLALERSVRNHARLQNAVADVIIGQGFVPVSPALSGPQFDVAFEATDQLVVVEVKSCTADNAELQFRLGLGQVLRYASQLALAGVNVKPVLAVELDPGHEWRALLADHGVGVLREATLLAGMVCLATQWMLKPSPVRTRG